MVWTRPFRLLLPFPSHFKPLFETVGHIFANTQMFQIGFNGWICKFADSWLCNYADDWISRSFCLITRTRVHKTPLCTSLIPQGDRRSSASWFNKMHFIRITQQISPGSSKNMRWTVPGSLATCCWAYVYKRVIFRYFFSVTDVGTFSR